MRRVKFLGRPSEGMTEAGRGQGGVLMSEFKTCVVAFDVTEDLQHCAIGLANGEVVLIKGDLERERSPKMKRIRSSTAQGKLTFVGFPRGGKMTADPSATLAGRLLGGLPFGSNANSSSFAQLLYTVHEDWVTVWHISHKTECTEYRCEPQLGALPECSSLNDEGQLVVGSSTSNQIAVFGDEMFLAEMAANFDPSMFRAMQFAEVDGEKRRVMFHKHYVVVLIQNDSRPDRFTLQAYDLENGIRGLNKQQEAYLNVSWILSDGSDLVVICQEPKVDVVQQKVTRLTEEETQAKLEQLFSKECYDIAKKMAKKASSGGGMGDASQLNIPKRYGDHLYAKGKFSDAIDQYIEAIGQLEPSYVIRQFLDSQRIHHLTRYLEELHLKKHHDIANKNHTTLLLNCYTKLRDEQKLNDFIHRDDIRFDAHNAIKVCRQAGYFEAATYLAERYRQPSDYVKIQVENLHQPLKALQFVRGLPVDEAEDILKERGKEFVLLVPDDATDVLIELCTTWRGPPRRSHRGGADGQQDALAVTSYKRSLHGVTEDSSSLKPDRRASAHDLIHVFVDSPLCLLRFLRSVVDSGDADHPDDVDGQQVVYNTLLELYLTKDIKSTIKHMNGAAPPIPGGQSAAAASSSSSAAPTKVSLEPYAKRLEHAMMILERHQGKYDDYHALALVQQHQFESGILFMLERLQLYTEIFTHYSNVFETGLDLASRTRAKQKLIQTCEQQQHVAGSGSEGGEDAEREMWISLLSLLVRSRDDVSEDISRMLEHIEQRDLLPPVAVIEILSSNKNLKLRTVREYILRMLRKDAEQTEARQREVKEFSERTKKIKDDIRELQTTATVFQTNKCSHCNSLMDLPAVHFICKHSFHQRCLNDVLECNLCAGENRKVLQVQRELEDAANNSTDFFRALAERVDGAQVVAEYFGRGIFSAPRLRRDAVLAGGPATFDDEDGTTAADGDDDYAEDEDDVEQFGEELDNPEEVELW